MTRRPRYSVARDPASARFGWVVVDASGEVAPMAHGSENRPRAAALQDAERPRRSPLIG
jgi:hypothetical protein